MGCKGLLHKLLDALLRCSFAAADAQHQTLWNQPEGRRVIGRKKADGKFGRTLRRVLAQRLRQGIGMDAGIHAIITAYIHACKDAGKSDRLSGKDGSLKLLCQQAVGQQQVVLLGKDIHRKGMV